MFLARRLILVAVFTLQLSSQVRAEDVTCPTVMAEVNRRITRHVPVDVSEMAKKLHTKIVWVEACLKAYGRRYRRPGVESDGGRDEVMEGYESGDDEDIEDLQDPDEPARR